MTARVRVTSNGVPPSRTRVRVIFWPILPRILSTASVMLWPRVGWPLILTMKSPAWMPALEAGVSSMGEIFRAEVGRMRIEVAEHALDGVFQQGLVIHRFDISGFDPVHHLGKGTQLIQRQWRLGGRSSARRRNRRGWLSGKRQRRADHQ